MLFSKLFYPSLSYWYQPLLFATFCTLVFRKP